jgi:nicotinamidase-related amidase
MCPLLRILAAFLAASLSCPGARAQTPPAQRTYNHRLTPVRDPRPLLADCPEFVEPITGGARFEAPVLADDRDADLDVRAWRYSYNARGIIEVPNRLRAGATAVVVVHPWGIDDGQGWKTPEPAGVAFAGTPEKNALAHEHMRRVLNPFLRSLRGRVAVVGYSLPGREDAVRKKLYRSGRAAPTAEDRAAGARELAARLAAFSYKGAPVPGRMTVSEDRPVIDYFRQLGGTEAGDRFNGPGFWDLPIPVARPIEVDPADVVFYDAEGYEIVRNFFRSRGVRHVLLCGYHADMCVCSTTAGYANLRNDFDVFLVGDATQATFPARESPAGATTATLALASRDLFITQVSWVRPRPAGEKGGNR